MKMAIPKISKADVEFALERIDREGIPKLQRSKKWCLVLGGAHYPPKYVYELAVEHLTGERLLPNKHSGGPETNHRLSDAGFVIARCACGGNTREF